MISRELGLTSNIKRVVQRVAGVGRLVVHVVAVPVGCEGLQVLVLLNLQKSACPVSKSQQNHQQNQVTAGALVSSSLGDILLLIIHACFLSAEIVRHHQKAGRIREVQFRKSLK